MELTIQLSMDTTRKLKRLNAVVQANKDKVWTSDDLDTGASVTNTTSATAMQHRFKRYEHSGVDPSEVSTYYSRMVNLAEAVARGHEDKKMEIRLEGSTNMTCFNILMRFAEFILDVTN